jgi:hypothetical protein
MTSEGTPFPTLEDLGEVLEELHSELQEASRRNTPAPPEELFTAPEHLQHPQPRRTEGLQIVTDASETEIRHLIIPGQYSPSLHPSEGPNSAPIQTPSPSV